MRKPGAGLGLHCGHQGDHIHGVLQLDELPFLWAQSAPPKFPNSCHCLVPLPT